MDINVYLHPDPTTKQTLGKILAALDQLKRTGAKTVADLTALQDAVAQNTSVEQSAVTLLKGLKDALDAAGTDPVALKALSDQLGKNNTDLAAAVAANTPAAP